MSTFAVLAIVAVAGVVLKIYFSVFYKPPGGKR